MQALDVVSSWPVDAAVGVIVRPTDRAPTPAEDVVGPTGRTFAWASVTKVAVALAVLVAVEEGTLSLDDPAGPEGSTVAHLLAHASGLGPEPGTATRTPGTRRIYTSVGFEVLGDLLAERSGIPLARYVAEAVLEPLGMMATDFDPDRRYGPPAGAGLQGPLTDLLALAAEWWVPTLVSPATHARAVSVAFPGLAGVLPGYGEFDPCDWGLGVEVKGHKAPHWSGDRTSPATFGHFGRSGSFVWIDPEAGVACAGLADGDFGPWATSAWPALATAVLGEVEARPHPAGPAHPS